MGKNAVFCQLPVSGQGWLLGRLITIASSIKKEHTCKFDQDSDQATAYNHFWGVCGGCNF